MNFSLDPSSGLADSYLDIEFSVLVPKHPKTIIHIYNEISKDQLQILGTSFGYILNGDSLVLKNKASTTGHINIFNHDKMNKKFLSHRNVTLRCVAEFYNNKDRKVGEEEESVIFYNEAYSLDANIIPFDLIIHNREVKVTDNEALSIDVISDVPRKYELCISSLDDRDRCHIEVTAHSGKTTVSIPGEFLYYDLGLRENKGKKFKFFYVKYQGTTISRVANRQYISVQNSEINFQVSGGLTPVPQDRVDPLGRFLSKEFAISDRYLVMCPSKYSGFARKNEFGKEKLMDLTMMTNEGQHMSTLSKQIQQFKANDDTVNINATEKSLQLAKQAEQAEQKRRRPQISTSQVQLMRSVSKIYDTISSTKPQLSTPLSKAVRSFSGNAASKKSGCAPCSRKRKQNA